MDEGTSDTAMRLWRVLRTPLTLLALLALLVVGFRTGYDWLTADPPPPQIEPCEPQVVSDGQLKSSQVTVRVFNAGGRRGIAGDVSRALDEKGFVIASTGNFEGEDAGRPANVSIIGGTPDAPEVRLVAGFFPGADITGDNRPDRSVEVRLGKDFKSIAGRANNTIDYDQPEICLPKIISGS